jgi:ElaB/YqjD/DUF883 family membrane-anchored ribosome-binding protein
MMEDTKRQLRDAVQTEISKSGDLARERLDSQVEEAREELEGRTDEARNEVGERLFDLGDEYFPEVASRRRREAGAVGFAAGILVGVVARHLLDR